VLAGEDAADAADNHSAQQELEHTDRHPPIS